MRFMQKPWKSQRSTLVIPHALALLGPCLLPLRTCCKPLQLLFGSGTLNPQPHILPLTPSYFLLQPPWPPFFSLTMPNNSHLRAFSLPIFSMQGNIYSQVMSHSSCPTFVRSLLKCRFLRGAFMEHLILNTNSCIFFIYSLFCFMHIWHCYIYLLTISV
jgi:hypothetical protein